MNAAVARTVVYSTFLSALSGLAAADVQAEPPSFAADIAPLLARHCLRCHDSNARKGELDLTTRAAAAKGGESGPAVVPGELADSHLWRRIADDEMPPQKPLAAAEKELLKAWIESGAKWDVDPIDRFQYSSPERAGYDWWSLQPIGSPSPPTVQRSSWVGNEIDRFVLAKLESHRLQPAPPADARVLVRRLYFDLVGLPPSAAESSHWVAKLTSNDGDESRETAYRQLVDHLLASPHYGERWARHWLDVVRFGESQGYERNRVRENAWRYRDWVIAALNDDLPYDEFVRRQVAGDVLYPDDLSALIATGYHVCGTWDQVGHNEGSATMRIAARQDHLEDLVASLGQTYLGLTVQCARCHDHKFDPLLQRDYYQIAAALGGVTQQEKERSGIALRSADDANASFEGVAHVVVPRQPDLFHVLERGDFRKPKEVVSPAGIQALARTGLPADWRLAPDAPEAERRKQLALWLTDPRNPLTPRVFVNRVWHYHFGQGIVDTPSDFGFSGGRPSHPELLDWLARRFLERGWRIKDLHRSIVTSATYRQAANVRHAAGESNDANNRLLWRATARRLEGEELRDAMLAVSGALQRQAGGPSYRDVKLIQGMNNNHEFTDPTGEFSDAVNRRTIYRLWARAGNNPLLEALDCPDPSVAIARRPQTITPVQSLSLINGRFSEQCAARFADRTRQAAGDDPEKQVATVWREAYGREPVEGERASALEFLQRRGLSELCLVVFNTNEFCFVE